jgi:hypothetical protein
MGLTKKLEDAQSALTPHLEPFHRNRTGNVCLKKICRALYQLPSARHFAKIVMNLKTREIDYSGRKN